MATYLFTWNPERWQWTYINDSISQVREKGFCRDRWNCASHKSIRIGDRAFLMRLGQEPKGIMAAGWVVSDSYQDIHWDTEKAARGEITWFVDVDWDTILDPHQRMIDLEWLEKGISSIYNWTPQSCGVSIPDNVAGKLEREWAKLLKRPVVIQDIPLAEEIPKTQKYLEGKSKQITVNIYERNSAARTMCINHHGHNCVVCGMNFEKKYGEFGVGYIHVHHLIPLSEIEEEYELDPIKDLVPICPNCHAMIHREKPALSIEELKSRLIS